MEYFSQISIRKLFNDYVANEVNLKSYYFGQPYDINGQPTIQQKYPGMLVTPQETIVSEHILQRNYQILIYDILDFEKSNEIEVMSDCDEFALRLIRFLQYRSEGFYAFGQPTITPFVDKFLDDVAGVILDVQIEFNNQSEDCSDPNPIFPITSVDIN